MGWLGAEKSFLDVVPNNDDAGADGSKDSLQRHDHAESRQHHDWQNAIALKTN